ncbi:cryptococcal mannosyltransferase 1-domain-containing protein [Mycena epipterygia]|nr:cryptococcal mannosyltransferase 1-domain-containing protein [Mycena epipterygia]
MRGIPGLSVAHVQYIRSIAEAVRDTVERTRYAISHRPLFRPLLLILRLLAFILTLIFRLCLRFSHSILSLAVLAYTLNAVWAFWLSKLSSSWGPAFPAVRTGYVITLVSLPIWGLAMAVLTLLWFALARVWGVVGTRLRRGQRYEPIVVDLDDLEPGERAERRGRGEEQRKGAQDGRGCARAKRGAGWFVLWCGYVALALFGVHMARTYELPVDHRFKSAVELANRVPKREGYGTGEKIFLAAMFYNNGGVLPYWITEVTKLIYYLGPDNVFVSIVESNSPDHTASLLEEFDRTLEAMGVARRVLTHDTTIERPASMETGLPRITFLAAVRNLAMQPLYENGGYTRVIFSNDVFIEAASIAELLDTKGGDYDMACGLDLAYWGLYDQWVIRDHSGRFASTLYPYFLEDMGWRGVTTDEPAPVFTCWNGIVAFRADPFLPLALRSGNQLSTKPGMVGGGGGGREPWRAEAIPAGGRLGRRRQSLPSGAAGNLSLRAPQAVPSLRGDGEWGRRRARALASVGDPRRGLPRAPQAISSLRAPGEPMDSPRAPQAIYPFGRCRQSLPCEGMDRVGAGEGG